MPYTFAVARHTAQKIREARDFLEVPICVENVSLEYSAQTQHCCHHDLNNFPCGRESQGGFVTLDAESGPKIFSLETSR